MQADGRGAFASPRIEPASLLSNGHYQVLLTQSGAGYSAVPDTLLTRWRPDPHEDRTGFFLYLRDRESGALWSAALWPVLGDPRRYEACCEPACFEILREEHGLQSRLQSCVHPELPMELRRLSLANRSARPRRIEVTSYIEVALDAPGASLAHPVFSQLFVETSFAQEHAILLARRRPRAAGEELPWMIHALLDDRRTPSAVEIETDRCRFVGRGRTLSAPRAMAEQRLSGTTGPVLDPILSFRKRVDLLPGAATHLTFALGVARDRSAAAGLLRDLASSDAFEEVLSAARAREMRELDQLGITIEEARLFHTIAAGMLVGDARLARIERRASPGAVAVELEALGLSVASPVAVLHAERPQGAALLPLLRRAHAFWKLQGLPVHLVELCGETQLEEPAAGDPTIHRIRFRDISERAREAVDARADLFVTDRLPDRRAASPGDEFFRRLAAPAAPEGTPAATLPREPRSPPLRFFNGWGGFSADGREYVIRLRHENGALQVTPRPWINVIANEQFGFLVSERGSITTWSRNSRLHRLTPWSNDPLLDPHAEAFYLRDEETAEFWSPLPGPCPAAADYEVGHGFGATRWDHTSHDLDQNARIFAARAERLQILTLRLTNRSARARRLSVWAYRQLALGALPHLERHHLTAEARPCAEGTDLLLARNPEAGPFAEGLAFAGIHGCSAGGLTIHFTGSSFTTDRGAFLGPLGGTESPVALLRGDPLDGASGTGLDACFAQQASFTIGPGEWIEITFLFGEVESPEAALALAARYRKPGAVAEERERVASFWRDLLGRLVIHTPEPALDGIVNGWLAYQTLACRIWARSAFYQSGGAFGYRDQLQDAAALITLRPDLTREQILLHAAHQFVEGDVLHWWHPPEDTGIRTRFADDLLWLPWAVASYIQWTGDAAVLDEPVPYLVARPLAPGEDEAYLRPSRAAESDDLYGHCCRAIDRSLALGPHALPLIGTGDWNDGMNRVGRGGKGESVWMGFFLDAVITAFLPIACRRGDHARADRYAALRSQLRSAIEQSGWDGAWYRRAYYDDGTPLGSAASDECRIDGLVQAWAVLSGAAAPDRAARAMEEVERQLISEADGLIRLLAPPFDQTPNDPGYIKGYPPGIRENGGQYTHAALWIVAALAKLGRRERVAPLLAMLSPITHASTPERAARYQLEPYVIAADVYGSPPHVGRGGWSWYTGSAGWMLRLVLESLLGLRVEGGEWILLRPVIPDAWPGFSISYRIPGEETLYEIEVRRRGARSVPLTRASLDDAACALEQGCARLPLLHDGRTHRALVELGGSPDAEAV